MAATSPAAGARSCLGARHLSDFSADRRVLLLVVLAVVIGVGGAGAAWLLIKLIALSTNLVWFGRVSVEAVSLAHAARTPWMVAAPVLGGVVIGLMARFGSEKIRGHGIPEAIEAILIGGSRMSAKVAVLKPLSSAISIGTGGPFGAEGPIIMTGGAIGSLLAQCVHLSAAERKTLLVAGSAAGMTAIFGTPVAAVLLAVELLLFEWRPRSFIPVVAAVVTATALRPALFGAGPLFPLSAEAPAPWWGLLACAGLGAAVGLQSGLLTKMLYALEDAFERLPIHWMWRPALGGLAVGLGGLIDPRALGVGYDVIGDLIGGHMPPAAVVSILLVKAAIWLVALSSGTSGGVLAPLLILGGAVGWLAGLVLPGPHGLWAVAGMAAMLGGTMRAPLTGALFAVELTGELHLLAPLLAASTAAYGVTVLLMKRSILTEKIARRGQHVSREYAVDPMEQVRVSQVMVGGVETMSADLSVGEAAARIAAGNHKAYPVVDRAGRPVGLAGRADALAWLGQPELAATRLGDLAPQPPPLLEPDQLAARAVEIMLATEAGRLLVVDPVGGALVGLVSRKDLLAARAARRDSEERRESWFNRAKVSTR